METGPTDSIRIQGNNELESKTNELECKTDGAGNASFTEQSSEMSDNFFKTAKEEIKNINKQFNVAFIKFIKRFESFSQNQKVSAFQSFDATFSFGKRSKIKVQPTAVSKRKSKIGSWQRQSNVGTKSLPNRPISLKRKHNMKEIVDINVPSAKKVGQSMVSNTKYFTKTKSKFKVI